MYLVGKKIIDQINVTNKKVWDGDRYMTLRNIFLHTDCIYVKSVETIADIFLLDLDRVFDW